MPKKIMIVEDEKDIADQYKMTLEERGHKVILANNGIDAFRVYKEEFQKRESSFEHPFDIVILDHGIPSISGARLADQIKAILPQQRIIFVTGLGNQVITNLTNFEEGGVDLMTKPISLENLIGMIEDIND